MSIRNLHRKKHHKPILFPGDLPLLGLGIFSSQPARAEECEGRPDDDLEVVLSWGWFDADFAACLRSLPPHKKTTLFVSYHRGPRVLACVIEKGYRLQWTFRGTMFCQDCLKLYLQPKQTWLEILKYSPFFNITVIHVLFFSDREVTRLPERIYPWSCLWAMGHTANGSNPAPIETDENIIKRVNTGIFDVCPYHLVSRISSIKYVWPCVGPYGWDSDMMVVTRNETAVPQALMALRSGNPPKQNDSKNFLFLNSIWTSQMSWYVFWYLIYPIGSMYGIFTYIYHKNQPNVGIYTIHGSYGYIYILYIL